MGWWKIYQNFIERNQWGQIKVVSFVLNKRVADREFKRKHDKHGDHAHHHEHYDFLHELRKTEKPLYPWEKFSII